MNRWAVLPAIALIGVSGYWIGAALTSPTKPATVGGHILFGSSRDGVGTRIDRLPGNFDWKETAKVRLVSVGSCDHCSRLRVESMPSRDASGLPVVMLTSSMEGYRMVASRLRKAVVLDRSGKTMSAIRGTLAPRSFVVLQGRIAVAETGDPQEDMGHGICAL